MSKNTCIIAYGKNVTVLPGTASQKIISGHATLADIRVLTSLCSHPELNGSDCGTVIGVIASETGLTESKVETSLAFWRGCGALEYTETETESESAVQPQKTAPEVKPTKHSPTYTGTQISELLDRDGGRLKLMIDQCEQYVGHMFNTVETSVMVGICDWLGLEPEFVITMTAYYTKKKPGCNVRYLEKAATDLVNNGITTLSDLDIYMKEMELYDGIAGKLRSWLGIGGRSYTKKENGMIKRWAKDFAYGEEIVRYAYELTVDAKGEFSFDYANAILENWYKSGILTREDAEKAVTAFKQEKTSSPKDGGSFSTDEFFGLAIKRSYSGMGSSDGEQ